MPFVAYKTFKIGPFNLTISKNGLSLTTGIPGIPGVRFGLTSNGVLKTSITKYGLSYRKSKKITKD